jgi:hypothetical protein
MLLLPAWKELLKVMELAEKLMPRDVQTRWNSTYTMLDFAIQHREALDSFCANRDFNMRKYEMSTTEWRLTGQLRDILRVSQIL